MILTRREVNTALMSSALTVGSSKILGAIPAAESVAPYMESTASSINLVHERSWHVEDTDESTHVLGNGRAMVHELGPNIQCIRAPWISSPNLLQMFLTGPASTRTVSSREQGAGIWRHKLYVGDESVGEIVDFLEEGEPCLRRVISCSVELILAVRGPRLADYSGRYPRQGSLLGQWPYGTRIFGDFLSSDPFTVQIAFPRSARFQTGEHILRPEPFSFTNLPAYYETRLELAPGRNELCIAVHADIAECLSVIDRVSAAPAEESLARTRQSWQRRLAKINWTQTHQGKGLPIEAVVDDVATLLLGYQSQAGCIAAGPVFPLFFIRDQYGASRALLALNLLDEAKALLAYYHAVWSIHGRLHNAQSDGPRHWFHRHENDDVEITGYVILQAFDYFKASKNEEFITRILPMLEWALAAQERHLRGNMLPFNGDETYVAGGIVPRTLLNDGSSEATLLYLASAERLVAWVAARKLWPVEIISQRMETLKAVKRDYGRNFLENGKLMVNNPRRHQAGLLPRFRHGVCLGRFDGNCLSFATTEVAEDGRYFCSSCYPKRIEEPYQAKRYFLPSIALTSSLIDYSAAPEAAMTATLEEALRIFSNGGRFAWPQAKLPGYETGVLSLALLQRRHPRASEFIDRMLELRDPTGIWVERYIGATPDGDRCRPWESSLNLLALLKYAATDFANAKRSTRFSSLDRKAQA